MDDFAARGMTDEDKTGGTIARRGEGFAVVGELVMISTALDFQLNRVLIQVLSLGESLMIEPIVATLDPTRKVEILRKRVGHMPKNDWRAHVTAFCDHVEAVFKQRNIACHTPPILENGTWTFTPVAAANLLQKIDLVGKTVKPSTIEDFKAATEIGERAFGESVTLIENFSRANVEQKRRSRHA